MKIEIKLADIILNLKQLLLYKIMVKTRFYSINFLIIIWFNIVTQDGMKAKKVEYNVYSKLLGNNLEKLNLDICKKTKILKI